MKYRPKNEGSAIALYAQEWIEIPPMEGLTIKVGLDVTIPIGYVGYIFGTTDIGRYGILFNNTIISNAGMHHLYLNVFNPSNDIVHIGEGEKIAYFTLIEPQPIIVRHKNRRSKPKNEKPNNSPNGIDV